MPRKPDLSYRATWVDPTTGKQRQVRCRTRASRDALQRRMRDAAWEVRTGLKPRAAMIAAERDGLPMADMLESYREYLEANGRSAPYIKNTVQILTRIADAVGWKLASSCNADQLATWLSHQDVSDRTRVTYGKAWRTLGAWAATPTGGWYPVDPFAAMDVSMKGAAPAGRRRPLTVAEYDRLVASSDRGEDYALMCHTGLRWTEAAALTIGDVRIADSVLVVPEGIGKTDSDRDSYVPIPRTIVDMLAARRQVGAAPLLRFSRPGSREWTTEIEAAGLPRVTKAGKLVPASMRATYSTWLAASGCPDDDRHRLRRDAGDIAESRYTDLEQLVDRLRDPVKVMVAWCDDQRRKSDVMAG